MAYYRLYLLDGRGSITECVDGDFEDDDAAVRRASELGREHGVSVWQEKRFVQEIRPTDCRLAG